ncbi:MAG TPA: thiosulfate oxidation carrier complex protein SoxZ [Methylibium sp.]|nr:thiosulfate oxidation carrier complex protein SoxZ [Methylibium sp.]
MLRRRDLLLLPFALTPLALSPARAADVAGFRRAAFDAHTMAELSTALGLAAPSPSADVVLQAPELSEDGAVVPVSMACALPGVQRLLLCVEKNPTLLAAMFELRAGTEASFATRLKMQQSSPVHALAVFADGRVLSASREVRVTVGGCVGAGDMVPERADQPTLIRVQRSATGAVVRALMKHDMESGQRKDGSGRTVPAWHIQEVVARVNGEPVWQAQWGTAVSRNPFVQFALKGVKSGDRIALSWADNRGAQRSDEVAVA